MPFQGACKGLQRLGSGDWASLAGQPPSGATTTALVYCTAPLQVAVTRAHKPYQAPWHALIIGPAAVGGQAAKLLTRSAPESGALLGHLSYCQIVINQAGTPPQPPARARQCTPFVIIRHVRASTAGGTHAHPASPHLRPRAPGSAGRFALAHACRTTKHTVEQHRHR